MAKVRCPCGRQYVIDDKHLGKRVRCAACGQAFLAKAVGPKPAPTAPVREKAPPRPTRAKAPSPATGEKAPATSPAPPPKPRRRRPRRIGDLAVERGFVSREQLDACLGYQEVIHRSPSEDDRRLGAILVEKGLLSNAQLQSLLDHQQEHAAGEAAEAAAAVPPRPVPREHPISQEHRESIRRTVQEAARERETRKAASTRRLPLPAPIRRLRPGHFAAAAALAVAAAAALWLWPPPLAARTLAAYLTSCSEDSPRPDPELAARDLDLDVRSFGKVSLLAPATHDYAAQLAAFAEGKGGTSWAHLLRTVDMPPAKRAALRLARPVFPASITPGGLRALRVTVRPAAVSMVAKPRGIGTFREARYRFLLVRVATSSWDSGWKVAGYETADAP